jgi:two-component system sensor histidine kinase DesK
MNRPLAHDDGMAQGETTSPWLLWAFWLMWLPFMVQPLMLLVAQPPSLRKGITLVGLLTFAGVYLWATWHEANRLARARPGTADIRQGSWWPIALLAGLSVFLPFLQGYVGLGGFIYTSASVAGRLTWRQATFVFTGLLLAAALVGKAIGAYPSDVALMLFLIPAVGITVVLFSRTVLTNRELRLARKELARLAVAEERLRFARDLHDLLGHSLSLIALKSELASQLIEEDPAQAHAEVRDIESAARTALSEVREAVAGYRQATLASELARAQNMLAAAGIACRIQESGDPLPPATEALFTWVVREGVTNVIRHSQAKQCVITLNQASGEVQLAISDDGCGHVAECAVPGQGGNGLRGIAERVALLDGRCEAGPQAAGGFRVVVAVPVRQ